jgi:hypothetical protein
MLECGWGRSASGSWENYRAVTSQLCSWRILDAWLYWALGPGKCFHSDITGMCLVGSQIGCRHWPHNNLEHERTWIERNVRVGPLVLLDAAPFRTLVWISSELLMLMLILSWNVDSLFYIQMALPTDILWPYCNSVTEMTFVCVRSVVVCSTMSVAQTIHLQSPSKLAQAWLVVSTCSNLGWNTDWVTLHPAVRCCSIMSRYCPSIFLGMTRLGIEENQKRLGTKAKFSPCLTNWALCNWGMYIYTYIYIYTHFLVQGSRWRWAVGSTPWHPSRRLDGPESQSQWYGGVKIPDPAGTQKPTPVTQPVAGHYPGSPRLCSEYIKLIILWAVGDHLWGQSSWLQIQRSGFDSRPYQISWEVVGLEWGPLSLMSTTEELLDRKSRGCRDPSHCPSGIYLLMDLLLSCR